MFVIAYGFQNCCIVIWWWCRRVWTRCHVRSKGLDMLVHGISGLRYKVFGLWLLNQVQYYCMYLNSVNRNKRQLPRQSY